MLFDPELFSEPLFAEVDPVSFAPIPIFTVTRTDEGTPFTFTAPIKDPDAVERPGMDWSAWLQANESITTRDVFASDAELAVSEVTDADGVVSWRLSGGSAGRNYIVTCRIDTNAGRTDDRSILYRVRER